MSWRTPFEMSSSKGHSTLVVFAALSVADTVSCELLLPAQLPLYCLRGYDASECHGSQPHDHLVDNSHACAYHIHYNGENYVAPLPRESDPKTL